MSKRKKHDLDFVIAATALVGLAAVVGASGFAFADRANIQPDNTLFASLFLGLPLLSLCVSSWSRYWKETGK